MIDEMRNIDVLVGGQFGSEGKGLVAGEIAEKYGAHVRVGASNAGHTVYVEGEKHVVQSIPVAAYANPDATLILGPGALISVDILLRELRANQLWRESKGHSDVRLVVDPRAHIITDKHVDSEQNTDLADRIGSTSTIAKEGIGAATAARVMREEDCELAGRVDEEAWQGANIVIRDTVHYIDALRQDTDILLEGTQGTGLSLTTGDFPYVTSRNPTASGIAADCGVAPNAIRNVLMVLRTFPIRVAGNSGPFGYGSQEVSFDDIGVDPERTTVTKLQRRIATFSMIQAQEAAIINGATHFFLTFGDYIAKGLAGCTQFPPDAYDVDPAGVGQLVSMVNAIDESLREAVITGIGTGPDSMIRMDISEFGAYSDILDRVSRDRETQSA